MKLGANWYSLNSVRKARSWHILSLDVKERKEQQVKSPQIK